jgi:hypothetical protein
MGVCVAQHANLTLFALLFACRRYPAESRQAVSALVRALLLRAPDRADARAAAIASVQELVSDYMSE